MGLRATVMDSLQRTGGLHLILTLTQDFASGKCLVANIESLVIWALSLVILLAIGWLLKLAVEEELFDVSTVELGSVYSCWSCSSSWILLVGVKSFYYAIDSFLTANWLISLVVLGHLGSLHLPSGSLVLKDLSNRLHLWLRRQVSPLERRVLRMTLAEVACLSLLASIPCWLVLDANYRVRHHKLWLSLHILAFSRLYHVQHSLLLDAVIVVSPQVDLILMLDWARDLWLGFAIDFSSDFVTVRETRVIVALLVCKAFLDFLDPISSSIGKRVSFAVPTFVCISHALNWSLKWTLTRMISLELFLIRSYLESVLNSSMVLLETIYATFWLYVSQKFPRFVRLALDRSVATQ